jgi:hypothetical protein
MRVNRPKPLQLLARLLMAAVMLAGMVAGSHGMIGAGHEGAAQITVMDAGRDATGAFPETAHAHDCCPPQQMAGDCSQTCSAVTCAVPILPGAPLTHFSSMRESVWPYSKMLLRGGGPELETPPPRRLIRTM